MKLLKFALVNVISLGWICAPSFAVPKTNENGDYILPLTRRFNLRQVSWIVIDKDPKGLNCRMAQEYQGIDVDSIDAPVTLYEHNLHSIANWPVVTTFNSGEQLRAITNNFGNNIVLQDNQGKPWIPVESNKGHCFVRANSQFIAPVPEDSNY